MKKCFFLLFLQLCLISCDKDENINSENNDNNSLGIYSGVMVGSSGYYVINIEETGSKAQIFFDGKEYNLTNSIKVKPNDESIDVNFTDGDISVLFSVKGDGTNPVVNFSIPNHNITSTIDKIYTTGKFTSYEGTSSSNSGSDFQNAVYNLVLRDGGCSEVNCKTFGIIEKITNSSYPNEIGKTQYIQGTYEIKDNKITFKNFKGDILVKGTIDSETISHSETSFRFQFTKRLEF